MKAANVRFVERLIFLLLLAALFAWVAWESRSFPRLARVFPQTVSVAALVLSVLELIRMLLVHWRRKELSPKLEETPSLISRFRAVLPYLLWIGGYYLGIYFFGFVVASGVFVLLFGTLEGKMRWYTSLGATLLLLLFLIVFGDALNLYWPQGVLERWFEIDLP